MRANAIGISRGGRTTKIHALVDVLGRPLRLVLTPGNTSDVKGADLLIGETIGMKRVIADRSYRVSGCRARPLLAPGSGLVDAEPPDDRSGPPGIADGRVAPEAGRQGAEFTSMAWAAFIRAHNLEHSISRLGNFNPLKRERIRRRTYRSRDEARRDVFVYIEAFNSKLRSECLNAHWLLSLQDACEKLEAWRRHYNEERPHSAIGNIPR